MDIIIEEVENLPDNPQEGVWYYYQYNYYYFDGESVLPDRTDGQTGGGGTAENPAPVPTQRPNDR